MGTGFEDPAMIWGRQTSSREGRSIGGLGPYGALAAAEDSLWGAEGD